LGQASRPQLAEYDSPLLD